MSLIGTGTQLRNRAMQGLQAVSNQRHNQIANDSLDAQESSRNPDAVLVLALAELLALTKH